MPHPVFRVVERKRRCRLLNVRRAVSRVVHTSATVEARGALDDGPHGDGHECTKHRIHEIVVTTDHSGD